MVGEAKANAQSSGKTLKTPNKTAAPQATSRSATLGVLAARFGAHRAGTHEMRELGVCWRTPGLRSRASDVANPDTYKKFYSDVQMYNTNMGAPDPEMFMRQFVSWEVASKQNKWQGRNVTRWRNEAYDAAFRAAEGELDPVKRAALFIAMNDLIVQDPAVIPIVHRPVAGAMSHKLRATLSGWDNTFWNLRDWYREA